MSIRELYEWYSFYSEEPFFPDRVEIQLAHIGYIAGSFAGSKSKYDDYMVSNKKKKQKQTTEEFESDLLARFKLFAKSIK